MTEPRTLRDLTTTDRHIRDGLYDRLQKIEAEKEEQQEKQRQEELDLIDSELEAIIDIVTNLQRRIRDRKEKL